MNFRIKNAAAFIVSFIIIGVVAFFIFNGMLKKTIPVYDGEVAVTGIKDEVNIYRDSLAIPYIIANNDEDAAFSLGYVHAQERMFQMDMMRRAAEGRLSEVFGSRTLPFDEMFLTVGIKRFAYNYIKQLDPYSLKILQAYSNGINQYLKNNAGKNQVEFDVLGYRPEEWKPVHSLMIIRMVAWELNISWWSKFSFINLINKVGYDKAKEIIPDYPSNAPHIISNGNINSSLAKIDQSFRDFLGEKGTHIGSNNWAISGNKSVSGKPIIANDPHLGYSMPGKWYAAVIKSPNWNAEGITLPGVPCIVIGKNQNISWTFTNIMIDDADFYEEKLDPSKTKYQFNNEWKDLKIIHESIKVKDSNDVELQVKLTHRGPIITDIHPLNYVFSHNHSKVNSTPLSMRWTGNDFSDEFTALFKINKASGWQEFKQAVQGFSVPGQNFVYADKFGNIGYLFGGRIPKRASSPSIILDGNSPANDWQGYVPFSELPSLFNPPSNFIATANNKTSENFPYYISNIWEPSSRIERITQLLTYKEKHSVQDFKNYQMDQVSPYAFMMKDEIIKAFDNIKVKDKNLNETLELFRKWDGSFNEESQVPAIYAVFFNYLLEDVFEDEMGQELYNEYVFVANVPYRSIMNLMQNPSSAWWDNVRTSVKEDKEEIIRQSLSKALTFLENKFGKDLTDWQWGSLHKVLFKHTFAGFSDAIDKKVNIGPYNIGGDGTTVFNTEYSFQNINSGYNVIDHNPFENYLGPSMRFIYDFKDSDVFYLVLTTGQSGNIFSEHYKDMFDFWLSGKYISVRTDLNSVKENHLLLKLVKE